MNKADAVIEIARESHGSQITKAGLLRVRRSAKVLGLSPEELVDLEVWLEFRNRETRELYPKVAERTK